MTTVRPHMVARMHSLLAAGVALLCAGTFASAAGAADLYLAPGGMNGGDCQTQWQPCSSVTYVQTQAASTPEADTVHLAAGDYLPDVNFLSVANVTWSGPQAGVPARRQTGATARIAVTTGGFGFIVQADGIAFDGLTFQSADYEASDGSFGVYNLNPSTIRNSVFTHILTGIYGGSAVVVSGVRLETNNDAMYTMGSSTTVSDTTFSPPAAYAGLISGGNGPVTVTGSTFTRGAYGFLTYAGTNAVTLSGNRFSPSIANGVYNDGSPLDARGNWWGCNAGPNQPGCATLTGPGVGQTTTAPRLVLGASVEEDPVAAGSTAVVTAALDHDSAGDPVATDFPSTSVRFATTLGTLDQSSAPLQSGTATATLTAPNATGTADVTVTLDGETVHVPLEIKETPPTIAADGGLAAARSGTTVAVSGGGHPGTTVQVKVNGAAVGLPVTVTAEGTWNSTVTLVDGDNRLQVERGLLVVDGPTVVGVYAPVITSPQADDEVAQTPTVEGTGIAGAAVDLADGNGAEIGSGTVEQDGTFAVTADPLTAGPHTLHVTQTVGGAASLESTVAVTVLPGPEITLPVAGAHVRPRFSMRGTAHPDVALTVVDENDVEIGATTATANGAWALRTSTPLADGPHTLTIVETFGAIVLRSTLAVVVDPAAPLLAAPAVAVDGPATVVEGATVSLTGTALANAVVVLQHNGSRAGDVVADASGRWTATASALAGDNAFTATQELPGADPGESGASAAVHAIGIGTPGVASPDAGAQVQTTFDLAGSALPGATITVAAGATTLATATADATTGAWSATTAPLAYGDHTLTVSQRLDGVTGASVSLAVSVVPGAPTLTHPDGSEAGDGAIDVAGTADANADVDVFLDGGSTAAQSTTAGPDGAFAVTVAAARGTHTVRVSQHVGGSLSGPLSAARSIEVLPARPTLQLDSAATVAAGDPIAVSGTAEPGATVLVDRTAPTGVRAFTTVADGVSGAWSLTLPAASRTNTVSARQQPGGAGSISLPARPDVVVTGLSAPVVTAPAEGETVAATFTVTGTAQPLVTVIVVDESDRELGTTTAGTDGAWSLTTALALAPGRHTLVAHAWLAGVDGPASAGRAVTVGSTDVTPDPRREPTRDPTPIDPTPDPDPPTPGPDPAPPSSVFSLVKPSVRGAAITLALKLPGAGRVKATATIVVKGKRIVYGTVTTTAGKAGAKRLVLKPSRTAKAALKRLRSAKVSVTVTFTATGGRPAVKTTRATVRGGRRR